MEHVRRFSWCGQRRRSHEARWELGVLMMTWLALNRCEACLPSELQALVDIQTQLATEKAFFHSWDVNTDCCRNWRGISCDSETGAVSLLQLARKGKDDPLRFGEFPAAVCNLTELRGIIITGARFHSGGFPPCLWHRRLKVLDMSHSSFVHDALLPNHGLKHLKVLRFRSVRVPNFNWRALFHPNSSLEVLDLTNSGLTGSLDAADFGGESRLRYMSLRSNRLEGQIPRSLGNLTSLYEMDLSYNRLNGSIPSELGNLRRLTILQLRGNKLSGKISKGLSRLRNLISLDLGNNTLKGQIPERFENLSKLEKLKLDSNKLEGELPASLGNLRNLKELSLKSNFLTGKLPIANMSRLEALNVGYNAFEEIPELKDLTSLRVLEFRHNGLKGRIPATVGRLSAVESLILRSNRFSGPIPEFLGNLTTFTEIDLAHNKLQRSIPDALVNLRTEKLGLQFNKLSGPVPPWFRNMTTIRSLNISHNSLSGSIPESFFSWNIALDLSSNGFNGTIHPFENMLQLHLSNNNLTGNLPSPSGNLSSIGDVDFSFNLLNGNISVLERSNSLHRIILSSNHFGGRIPDFRNLPYLEVLHLGSNQFRGSIPSLLGSLRELQSLKLPKNQLIKPIPDSLGNLSKLHVLDLSENRLSGVIPGSLGNLQEMVQLKLQNNHLTGSIPAFCNEKGDHQLRSLSLGDNRLHGKIPPSFGNCTKLNVLDLANNRLTGKLPFTPTLRVLLVSSNNLGGRLPQTLAHAESLQILDISSNRFRGKIPRNLGKLNGFLPLWNRTRKRKVQDLFEEDISFVVKGKKLRFTYVLTMQTSINLSFNNFTDRIPAQFGLLHGLQHLNLSGNSLSGRIPEALRNITRLESLDVSRNRLTGHIPKEFESLSFLSDVNFSVNLLSGRIPTEHQFQTFTLSSYLENPGLCGPPLGPCDDEGVNTIAVSLESREFTQGFKLGFSIGFSLICVIGSAYFYFSSFQDLVSECVDSVRFWRWRLMYLLRCNCFQGRGSTGQVSDESDAIPRKDSTRQDDEAHISRWAYGSASG